MLGADLYGAALVATVAWIILIYVIVTIRPGRTGRVLPAFRRRFRSHVPSPVKGFDPGQHAEQQLLAVITGSFEPGFARWLCRFLVLRQIYPLLQWLAKSDAEKVNRAAGESRNRCFRQDFQALGWYRLDPSGESGLRIISHNIALETTRTNRSGWFTKMKSAHFDFRARNHI